MKTYLRDIHRSPALPKAEQLRLGALCQIGDLAARTRLIESILPLVVNLAKRIQRTHPHCELDDLVQVGNSAALHCVDRYEPARNCCLTTLAHVSIRRWMLNYANENRTIRVPRNQFIRGGNPKYREDVERATRTSSLDEVLGVSEPARCETQEEESRERRLFRWAVKQLPLREQYIILSRYHGKTLAAIGEELGVGKERVRQIADRALREIKELINKRGK